jgi:SAM-dependent methyltransferase
LTQPILLDHCPACNHDGIIEALPQAMTSDNSLGRLLKNGAKLALPGFDLAAHRRSRWSVCSHCALIFARSRPSPEGLSLWYPPLFQLSEERGYNTAPLPQAYLAGKRQSAEKLFRQIDAQGVLAQAKSLIHFRTGPGHFLDMVRKKYSQIEVYGLEYFEHPAAYAKELVGEDRVAQISTPEPEHPFPVQKFDVIVANHFLTHAHEPRKFLDYLRSILSEQGTLIVYNELDHDRSLRSMTAYPRGLNFFHKQLFTRPSLLAFLKSCGFEPQDISAAALGRPSKYITLFCKPAAAKQPQRGEPGKAAKLLRSWFRKHRLYRSFRFVIDPARRLFSS